MLSSTVGGATTDEFADDFAHPGHCGQPTCQRWRWEALHDPLTGVANRRLLDDRLSQALLRRTRAGAPLTVLFIDLDGFRGVNGRYGHLAADRVLTTVARRVSQEVRAFDTVGRLGGDEFVIVLEGVAAPEALELADRLRRAIARPLSVAESPDGCADVAVTASIGVSWARDDDDVHRVIHGADLAMYAAKRRGGNLCYVVGGNGSDGARVPAGGRRSGV